MSRAAFKLLEVVHHFWSLKNLLNLLQINDRHKIFKSGNTVVDLVITLDGTIARAMLTFHLGLCSRILVAGMASSSWIPYKG